MLVARLLALHSIRRVLAAEQGSNLAVKTRVDRNKPTLLLLDLDRVSLLIHSSSSLNTEMKNYDI
jgi:hypothetical protein